ncbi:exodeoxyribonuclease III [Candidatus Parcubacteria bacterium]|nr:MAG: exodeoxyribonuclease III [Candidatus Parcubacteria bacterium]
MKILSWNVNGIRAAIRKGFVEFLNTEKPDVIGLQEIKISDAARAQENFDFADYQEFWNSADRPGYSGTAFLVKNGLEAKALPKLSWDDEGRVQVIDIDKFYLANVYFPNAKDDLSRLGWKIDWNDKLLTYFKKLAKKKPLIVTGDYNVANEEIDLARPKPNVGNAGFTDQERAWMKRFLAAGFKDTFRQMHPNKVQYSWWSYRANARANNVGWRIDYFCVSDRILKKVSKAFILDKVLGSDHAPIGIEIK